MTAKLTIIGEVIIKPLHGMALAFAQEYTKDYNGYKAAVRAGYSEKTAKVQASALLTKPNIKAYILEHQADVRKKTVCDAAWLLDHLHAIAMADVADILNDEGYYLPIKEWPVIWRQMINGMDIQRADIGEAVRVEMKKVKLMDRNAVLEKIGKHISVGAFSEKNTVGFSDEVMAQFFKRLPDTTGLPDISLKTLADSKR